MIGYKNIARIKFDDDNYENVDLTNIRRNVVGQSIVNVSGDDTALELELSNGYCLTLSSNEGCGGCGNGWFYCNYKDVLSLGLTGNVITDIKCVVPTDICSSDDIYRVSIYSIDKRYNIDFSGSDNGYYGTGIYIDVDKIERS